MLSSIYTIDVVNPERKELPMDLGNDREHLDKPTKCIAAGNFCCFKYLQPAGGGPGYDGCRLGSSSDVVTYQCFHQ